MNAWNIISVDAWRNPDGGWDVNDQHLLNEAVPIDDDDITPRKILRLLRELDALSPWSKGRLCVDFTEDECIVIRARGTQEPIIHLIPEM